MRQEVQVQMMQELMSKMTEKCFTKCAGKSGETLDSRERTCMSNCMDRYMETMTVVHQALNSRQSLS
jgi:import inner membrane translocase subunit TIM13